jgi:hypothetical protein
MGIEVFGAVLPQSRQRLAVITPRQADRRQFALLTGQPNFIAFVRNEANRRHFCELLSAQKPRTR